jgi:hypothetical protein
MAQRRRLIGIKQRVQQYIPKEERVWNTAPDLMEDQNARRERERW